jgi:hypothetical protein
MTPREKLMRAVLDLPESELEPVAEILASRGEDPLLRAIANAPEDDEPWTDEDEAAVQESRDEVAAGVPLIPLEQVMRELGDA